MRHFDFWEEHQKNAWPFRVCLANRMFHRFKYSSYPKHLKHLLLSGLVIGTRTYFPFLFTCVWQLQPIQVSLRQHEMSEKTTCAWNIDLKRGGSPLGEKTICLQMVLPKKHYSTYAHAGGPRHATQTDVFDRTASSLVALVINLMVTDFYLEKPHCLETSKSRCCYVSCRRPVFSSVQEHCGGS